MIKLSATRFDCTSGVPRVVQLFAEVYSSGGILNNEKWVKIRKGVTGYESFCLTGEHPANKDEMTLHGWTACTGDKGRWDTLYIHGLQMQYLFTELEKSMSDSICDEVMLTTKIDYNKAIADAAKKYTDARTTEQPNEQQQFLLSKLSWMIDAEQHGWNPADFTKAYTY